MLRSLVGSEMCIRDRVRVVPVGVRVGRNAARTSVVPLVHAAGVSVVPACAQIVVAAVAARPFVPVLQHAVGADTQPVAGAQFVFVLVEAQLRLLYARAGRCPLYTSPSPRDS